eukprot:scaffold128280_cov57-Phaeocystis_antarctica.AAC.5
MVAGHGLPHVHVRHHAHGHLRRPPRPPHAQRPHPGPVHAAAGGWTACAADEPPGGCLRLPAARLLPLHRHAHGVHGLPAGGHPRGGAQHGPAPWPLGGLGDLDLPLVHLRHGELRDGAPHLDHAPGRRRGRRRRRRQGELRAAGGHQAAAPQGRRRRGRGLRPAAGGARGRRRLPAGRA